MYCVRSLASVETHDARICPSREEYLMVRYLWQFLTSI